MSDRSSALVAARNRKAALTRHRGADDPATLAADAELRAAVLADHLRRLVNVWPPLTSEQRAHLALLLRPDVVDDVQRSQWMMRERVDVKSRLFSAGIGLTGADLASFRDADDRAVHAKDSDAAMSLLDSAIRTGDVELADAVARRALTETDREPAVDGWDEVYGQWQNYRRSSTRSVEDSNKRLGWA